VVLAVILTGCQVTAAVVVRVGQDGTGTVTVTVTLDRAATAAVGGVEGQLRTSDLAAAGWTVTSGSGADGSTVVTLAHGFSQLSEVPAILADVARAPGGAHAPLFVVHVGQTRTFWRTTTTAGGTIDLTCGLSCFGDDGLTQAYGSELGVDPGRPGGPGSAATAAHDVRFSFRLELPGRVTSSSGAGPGRLGWTPTLGQRLPVSARATVVDRTHVREVSAAGGVTVIGIGVVVLVPLVAVRRRGRFRRRPNRSRAAGAT
jgi:hypothetical protein